jgi:hypothetical protein
LNATRRSWGWVWATLIIVLLVIVGRVILNMTSRGP